MTARARTLRRNMTDAEKLLWSRLRANQTGLKWRRQVPIGPYIVDFMCKRPGLVVELDGGQHDETVDATRTAYLEGLGLKVMRFWNNETLHNLNGVMEMILDEINKHPNPSPSGRSEERPHISVRATHLTHSHDTPAGTLTLPYDDRFRRRMAMTSDNGIGFLLDLVDAQELRAGDSLVLDDGRLIRIVAADEPLMEAVPSDPGDLARVAWHVGNRHLTCQVLPDRLVLRADKVIAEMLEVLGCTVTHRMGPFTPEGGAYGQGRTHSHAH